MSLLTCSGLSSTRGGRTALENVRQRMRYHYGERGKLEVDAGDGYYQVAVSIPRA